MANHADGRLTFILKRLRERLWVRPLAFCILSVAGVFAAKFVGGLGVDDVLPDVSAESIETLLSIVASSMLVVATFAVGSMVSAYASASGTATPRSFPLIVADDVSQNALSAFIGAFIYSIVALITMQNGYFDDGGRFALFAITVGVFVWVVLTFVRWVDKIARLGRMGNTIDKVEAAAKDALERRRSLPLMGGAPVPAGTPEGEPLFCDRVGYVQHIDMQELQRCAEAQSLRITITALPGTFLAPGRPLCHVAHDGEPAAAYDADALIAEYQIGDSRVFEHDPRFGLITLSEIASRALSPAVNDPGTAIDIIGRLVRLFARWAAPRDSDDVPLYPRIHVPALSTDDLFEDAFSSLARDGADTLSVQVRLQKALRALSIAGDGRLRDAARAQARQAVSRAESALDHDDDVAVLRDVASWAS